jgi:hypothetical protein
MSNLAQAVLPFERYSGDYAVPIVDLHLMALNLSGLSSDAGKGRARMEVRLFEEPAVEWHMILPTRRRGSPFAIDHKTRLTFSGNPLGTLRLVEHDDAQLGYLRDSGRVITLNTNSRSICTGCVFCPNTLGDANDPRIATAADETERWLETFLRQHDWSDLGRVSEINLSTGCFGNEGRAIEHLSGLRHLLGNFGFRGRLGILSSVIRSESAMQRLREVGPFALFLTLECITRRALLLKESKANLSAAEAIEVLRRARSAGHDTGVMIVVGLDPLPIVGQWLQNAVPYLTDFPNLQLFQSHSPLMDVFRVPGAERLDFFLNARRVFEEILAPSSLRPLPWQNYRPLWHYTFGTEDLLPWRP